MPHTFTGPANVAVYRNEQTDALTVARDIVWDVFTARGGTRIYSLTDLQGNPLPGGQVTSDADGRIEFLETTKQWPILWLRAGTGSQVVWMPLTALETGEVLGPDGQVAVSKLPFAVRTVSGARPVGRGEQLVHADAFNDLGTATDDSPILQAATDEARITGKQLAMEDGRDYRLNAPISVDLYTSTRFNGATLRVDESIGSTVPAVRIMSARQPVNLTASQCAALGRVRPGVDRLTSLAGRGRCLLHLRNSAKRVYLRRGSSTTQDEDQFTQLVIDNRGYTQSVNHEDLAQVTSAILYPLDDVPMSVEGLHLHSTNLPAGSGYVQRNVVIDGRSDATLAGFGRTVDDATGRAPHQGGLRARNATNVLLEDVAAHTFNASTEGTYDLNFQRVLGLYLRRVRGQNLSPDNDAVWGTMGTYSCQDVVVQDSQLSRIDAHRAITNLAVHGCELGGKGISVVGKGLLLIRDSTFYSPYVIRFRDDYGAWWDGTIDAEYHHVPPPGVTPADLDARVWRNFDFNLDRWGMARGQIRLRGTVDLESGGYSSMPVLRVDSRTDSAASATPKPYLLPARIDADVRVTRRASTRHGLTFADLPGDSRLWLAGDPVRETGDAIDGGWVPNIRADLQIDFERPMDGLDGTRNSLFSNTATVPAAYLDDAWRARWAITVRNSRNLLAYLSNWPVELTAENCEVAQAFCAPGATWPRLTLLGGHYRPLIYSSTQQMLNFPADRLGIGGAIRMHRATASSGGVEVVRSATTLFNQLAFLALGAVGGEVQVNASVFGAVLVGQAAEALTIARPDLADTGFRFGSHTPGERWPLLRGTLAKRPTAGRAIGQPYCATDGPMSVWTGTTWKDLL